MIKFPQIACLNEVHGEENYAAMIVSIDHYVFKEVRYYLDGHVEVLDSND